MRCSGKQFLCDVRILAPLSNRREFPLAVRGLDSKGVRAIILRGEGQAFSAGLDINDAGHQIETP